MQHFVIGLRATIYGYTLTSRQARVNLPRLDKMTPEAVAPMDLQELAQCTGLPLRKLRYVLDHQLLPGLTFEVAENEAGRPRRLAMDVAFGVACVASLLDGGVQRSTASFFIDSILKLRYPTKGGTPWYGHEILAKFLERGESGHVQLGDCANLRLQLKIHEQFDTWWLQAGTSAKLDARYQPRTLIDLDVGWLRRAICGKEQD